MRTVFYAGALLLLVLLFRSPASEGAFLSGQVAEIPRPFEPQFVFFWRSRLFALLGILNGPVIGQNALLVQLDAAGNVTAKLEFVFACTFLACNVDFDSMVLSGDILTVAVDNSVQQIWFSVDMPSLSIVATSAPTSDFSSLIPGSSSQLFAATPRPRGFPGPRCTLQPIDPANVQPLNKGATLNLKQIWSGVGAPDAQSLIACVEPNPPLEGPAALVNISLDTGAITNALTVDCSFTTVSPNNLLIAAIETDFGKPVGLFLHSLAQPLPRKPSLVDMDIPGYATGTLADNENLFIGARLWANQDNSTVFQVNIRHPSQPTIVDSFPVPYPWLVFNYLNSQMVSYGLDSALKQLVTPLKGPSGSGALLLLNYD
jgi:hypothetical protein